ncbi:MAG: TolC family protein [Bacteroidota bacterium]|nr:TolC family protein [Bacteroidota bacterium]
MYSNKQNNHTFLFILSLFFAFTNLSAQMALQFNSLDSLFKYAGKNSATIKTGYQQSLSAKWTKIASLGNTINLRSPFTAAWTDNTILPVSYLPAEAFGGPAGTLKPVSLGQQYVSSYGITPQIDIINPSAWARIKSAELNKQLTETNNLVAKKNLFESISASYYNIVALQYQIKNTEQSVGAADSILLISKTKFAQGIIREQDVNNATINFLNIQDKLVQLKLSLEQNYNSLKILCDIKPEGNLQITESVGNNSINSPKASSSSLIEKQSQLQSAYFKSELNVNRLNSFSPTLSLIFNQTWQQNSNLSFTDANSNNFTSQYIGIKFTMPFPFDVNRLSTNYTTKINYNISNINYMHSTLQNQINNKQLDLEYQKASSTYNTAQKINELKTINYQKSINQYNEGIISTDILLTAFTDKINAELNYSAAFAGLKYAETKININNTIQ